MRLIEENRERCGAADRCVIIRDTVEHALDGPLPGGPFNLIVLDPPYGAEELTAAIESAASIVGPETLLIVEHATRDPAPEQAGLLERTREVVHGDSALAFYRRSS